MAENGKQTVMRCATSNLHASCCWADHAVMLPVARLNRHGGCGGASPPRGAGASAAQWQLALAHLHAMAEKSQGPHMRYMSTNIAERNAATAALRPLLGTIYAPYDLSCHRALRTPTLPPVTRGVGSAQQAPCNWGQHVARRQRCSPPTLANGHTHTHTLSDQRARETHRAHRGISLDVVSGPTSHLCNDSSLTDGTPRRCAQQPHARTPNEADAATASPKVGGTDAAGGNTK